MFFTVQSLIVYGAELTLSGAMENLDCVTGEGDSDCADSRTRDNNASHYPTPKAEPSTLPQGEGKSERSKAI